LELNILLLLKLQKNYLNQKLFLSYMLFLVRPVEHRGRVRVAAHRTVEPQVHRTVEPHNLKRLGLPCSCDDELYECFHPGRTVDPALLSIIETVSPKTAASAPGPAVPERHRGHSEPLFRLLGCGQICGRQFFSDG
jgi:hypothetical protein